MTRYLQLIAVAALVFLALMFVAPVDAQRQVWSNAEFKGTVTGISGGATAITDTEFVWLPFGDPGSNGGGSVAQASGTALLWPITNPQAVTINRAQLEIQVQGSATTAGIAFYKADGTLVSGSATSGTISGAGALTLTYATPVAIPSDARYLAFSCNGTCQYTIARDATIIAGYAFAYTPARNFTMPGVTYGPISFPGTIGTRTGVWNGYGFTGIKLWRQ